MGEEATKRRSDVATKGRGDVALLVAVLLLVPAGAAPAGVAARAIDYDLTSQRINIQSLRRGTLNFFGPDRAYRSEPVNRYLRLRLLHAEVDAAPSRRSGDEPWLIELVDGQRFRGSPARRPDGAVGDDDQVLRWSHAQLGELRIELERLSALGPDDIHRHRPTTRIDRVTLINGDLLTGFVTAVTEAGFNLELEGADQSVPIAFDRLRSLELANPSKRTDLTADMLHLDDGSRLRVNALTLAGDRVTFTAGAWADGRRIELPAVAVRRVDIASASAELVDLGALPTTITGGGTVFGMTWPHRIDGASISLHAPITVRFDLPPGARRLATIAALDAGLQDPVEWADFTVDVEVDDQSIGQYHFTADQAEVPLNIAVAGASVTFRLDPGANGPVMDRLRLVEPVVLIEKHASDDATRP